MIEVAEDALRPGGWATQDFPGYADAKKCDEATLGAPYRFGTVDTSQLNGSQTPDSFVVLFDDYRIAWFCDGRVAGQLEVSLTDGRWQVISHGQNTDWDTAVGKLGIDFAPACVRAYVGNNSLGSWTILADQTEGVIVHQLFSLSADAHTKAEFVEQLSQVVGR